MAYRAHSAIAAAAIALAAVAPVSAAERAFDRSFDVQAGGRLKVKAEHGSIAVVGSAGDKVVVRIRASGNDSKLDELNLSAERDGEGVYVLVEKRDRGFNWFGDGLKVNIAVEVPRNYSVDLQTAGGSLDVKQLNGNANGRTSGGRIDLEGLEGTVQMRTSGGAINARNLRGNTELHTSGGSISIQQSAGGLRAHTSGGPIRIDQAAGAIDASTSGGSINIGLTGANEGIVAKTSGGSINLRVPASINATINASTSGGRVSSDLALTSSEIGKSSLRGTVNGGGPEILARSSGGSISITKL